MGLRPTQEDQKHATKVCYWQNVFRPERTRISCHAALEKAACAPFRKEGRRKCINATKVNRKSGVA
jgi:hypothetical protein